MDLNESANADIRAAGLSGIRAHALAGVAMETHYHIEARSPSGELLWTEDCHNRVVTTGLNKLLDATFKTGLTTPAWYIGLCAASVTDGAITTGTANLVCATSTPFAAADAGRAIIVRGAAASGGDLVTTILTFTDSGHVVLAANAGTTVAAASVIFDARAGDTITSHTPWLESSAYSETNRQTFVAGTIAGGSVDNTASVATFTCNANNTLLGGMFLVDNNTKGGTTGTLYGMAPFTVSFRQLNTLDTLQVTATVTAAAV